VTNTKTRNIIVVLTPGRSGSSLLMRLLGEMGVNLSDKMIPGRLENPEGYFEDSEIVEVHKRLSQELNTKTSLPLPDGWVNRKPYTKARKQLSEILETHLDQSEKLWGFKDPRTGTFFSLWRKVFDIANIVPIFILALRDPVAIINSQRRSYNKDEAISELEWLIRTCDALHNTSADCFIVHYEDWFVRPEELSRDIMDYIGLNGGSKGKVFETIKGIIKPNLNRAVHDEYTIQNEYVLSLSNVLKDCNGVNFDRVKLMDTVKMCRRAMNGFKGWAMECNKLLEQKASLQQKLKQQSEMFEKKLEQQSEMSEKGIKAKKIGDQDDLQHLTLQNNVYLKMLEDLHEEVSDLRISKVSFEDKIAKTEESLNQVRSELVECEAVSKKEKNKRMLQGKRLKKRIAELKQRISILKVSYSYRIGQIFVNALRKPGKNTIILPFRFVRLLIEIAFSRKST